MDELPGVELPREEVPELVHVRDLIAYDGPLLSQFRHANGDSYLYCWCDSNEDSNRWMILRVAEEEIARMVNRIIPIDAVIPRASQDSQVLFLDLGEGNQVLKSTLVALADIPQSYQPQPGTFLRPGPIEVA